jgi:uncharacterized protein
MEILKYSKYNVITPAYNDNGSSLIMNLRANKLLKISASTKRLIECGVIPNDSFMVEELKKSMILVPSGEDELRVLLDENEQTALNQDGFQFTIFPSANCQLGCVYCGQEHTKDYLGNTYFEEILATVDRNLAKQKKHLHIGWFGAEPMMGLKTIQELTPKLKEKAAKYGCEYSSKITTNGLLLNKKNFEILLSHDVRKIFVSIDGTKQYHDERRFTKGGSGSFDVIMKNLKEIFNSELDSSLFDLNLRINVDRYNKDGIAPFLEMLAKLGAAKFVKEYDIAPIHSWGNNADERSLSFEEFANFKIDMDIKLLELGLMTEVSIPKRVRIVCQAVTKDAEYMDTKGNVFDCSEYPLIPGAKEKYSIGHITDKNGDERKEKRKFSSWNDEIMNNNISGCKDCRILPVCGGACPKSWKEGNIPCPDTKLNIGETILLAYLHTKHKKELFPQNEIMVN